MSNSTNHVTFQHNFGGRASASHFSAVVVTNYDGTRVLFTIANPSEFRLRENGTLTIYSRKHPSTSVYGISTKNRSIIGITRTGSVTPPLTF